MNQPTSSTAAAAASSPIRVLVIDRATPAAPRVAGLTCAERWRRAFADIETSHCFNVETVAPGDLPRALRGLERRAAVVDGGWVFDIFGLEDAFESGWERGLRGLTLFAGVRGAAPLALVTPAAAHALAEVPRVAVASDWLSFVAAARGALATQAETLAIGPEDVFEAVTNDESARTAEWRLLQRLQWRPGGLVAKHLNRPVSIRFSRLILNTPITPNQTTMVNTLVFGLSGVALIAFGDQLAAAAGGLLMQINSIVDGVDGELARLRHQKSEHGAFLDSFCDETLNLLLFAALGLYLTRHGYGARYLMLGLFAGAISYAYALVHWHCKRTHGLGFFWWWEAYKPRKVVQRDTSPWTYFKKLFWKETILLLVFLGGVASFVPALAPGGLWPALVWVLAGGAVPVAALLFIHIVVLRERY